MIQSCLQTAGYICSHIYIPISTFMSVCPYGVIMSHFLFSSCSEFQKSSQIASEQGKAKLLRGPATYTGFKNHMVRVPKGKSDLCIPLILKPHGQTFRGQVRLLLSEATQSYVYSILKPHSQSSRSPVRLLPCKAKPSYVYSILKPHGQIEMPCQNAR